MQFTRFMGLINAGRPFCETSKGGRLFKTKTMQNLKYKIVTYNGMPVDESMLSKGIYSTAIPTLHKFDTTIESIKDKIIELYRIVGEPEMLSNALSNLNQCEMQLVDLSFI